MPELPEVETVRRSLLPLIVGQKPRRIEIFNESVVACGDLADLLGLEIMDIGRRGKYLIIYFEKELTLVVHLRMTGRLLWRVMWFFVWNRVVNWCLRMYGVLAGFGWCRKVA